MEAEKIKLGPFPNGATVYAEKDADGNPCYRIAPTLDTERAMAEAYPDMLSGYVASQIAARYCSMAETYPPPNPSGILPTEFKVVIRPLDAEEYALQNSPALKAAGFKLADEAKDRQQFAQQEGVLVAVSPAAFSYFEPDVRDQAPKPGDRVLFAKFCGFTRKGNDGLEYRVVNDKDVAAVLV